jgi:hypothetical protein
MIKLRGLLTEPNARDGHIQVQSAHRRSLWQHLQVLLARMGQPRIEREQPDVNR